MRAICELSDAILFISEATRRDYERFLVDYNITNRAKTGVMILGEDINQKQAERPENIVDEPFILNVGTIEVRKNPVLLYQVYRLAEERGVDLPHLYLVGRMGWLTGDIFYQMIHDSRVSDKIHIRHDIDDKGLSWMYDHCEFFVFPSYYEGWGLPVAEAAHHHKVSVASHSSSIPEVLGEYAEYFSPYSADECLNAIVTMMDKAHRARCEKKLRHRAPQTWDDTYKDAEKIIDKVN
jgi:glycosyltransferase involved in cell wall biosynthesis